MALAKYRSLRLGQGGLNDKSFELEFFVEPRSPVDGIPGTVAWDIGTTYGFNAAVLYNGLSYNSLQPGNLGNQPDTSPAFWKQIDGKDGDIWAQVPLAGFPGGGSDVGIYTKANNAWQSLSGLPTTTALVDGQLAPTAAISFPSTVFPYAMIDYTVKRGAGQGRKRKGTLIILSDGASVVQYSHEFNEIGSDVNVPFTVSISGGIVEVQYTSALEGVSIELKSVLRGWA